ncbi:MAG: GDSL-type esterase/lipase family protein [Acutalibacteraceae bacterium]|nr:GDSL-type esterase/lipase family protein [Oscillospiraceae bacterium]
MKKIGFKSVAAVLAALIMLSSLPLGSFAADKKTGAGGEKASVSAAESNAKKHKHSFGAWKVTRKATTEKSGKQQRVCSGCGEKVTEYIPRIESVSLRYSTGVYNGKELKNKVTVLDKNGGTLKKDKDYAVSYKNNKYVGTAEVTVSFIGKYSGKLKKKFKIVPAGTGFTSITAAETKLTLKWKKNTEQVTGYEIACSTNADFKNSNVVKVGKKSEEKTIKGLTQGTQYYARIRTYKEVDGKIYYSAWSKVRTVKTKGEAPESGAHAISGSLPKSARVSPSYFDDAVFVGDSISLKLSYYEAANDVLGKAQFLTAGSLSATNALWDVSSESVHPRYKGTKMKLEKSIPLTGAKKVYIMLGMNDINLSGIDGSIENFKKLCKNIKKNAPYVKFYVQSVTPRVAMTSSSTSKSLTNAKIAEYNRKLSECCRRQGWYFLNVAYVMFDSKGNLKKEYCSDPGGMGMHFTNEGCKAWVDYLYTHTA